MANRLYDRLRKSIFKRLRKPAVRTVDGIRLTLNPAHALDRSLYIGHVAEQPQIDRMLRIVDDWRPQVFLDIGANIGLYALRLAAAGVAEIHAFEPVKATFDQLSQNIALNDWEDRIAAHHCAAGAEELQMTIDIDP
ncbi:MAG: FkbM family methyltransferase, partial [Hyphomicrobiales bacterium]|nr:FkbM family methyltransferase [Hyphomicrobiales bacterium]